MRKYVGVTIFSCVFLLLLPMPRWAAVEVKVGIYNNEPLVFTDNTGTAKGIFADILEYIAAKEEWTIQYLAGSFQQGLERLKTGEIDILCTIAYSKERDKWFDFTNENLLTNWGQIYTKKTSDIRTIIDLDNKKVSVVQGDIHYSALKKIANEFRIKCHFVETRSYLSAVDLIAEGEVDAAVINRFAGMKYAIKKEIDQSAIIFNPIRIHYAVPEGKNQNLISTIDKHIVSLKNMEGSTYYLSLDKWFGVASGRKVFPVWAKWFLIAFAGIILLLFLGNIILRFKVREKTKEIQKELAERQQAEEALRESEEQYRDLFENANELIQSVSCDGRLLRVNQKWKDTLGYSEEDIANISIWEIIHPESVPHCQEVFSKVFSGEGVDVIETTFLARDGTAIPVEGTATCRCVDGKPVSTRAIFRDISEKKRIEEEKNKLKTQLGRVQKLEAIGTLAGGVAHDFNNLLMTIQGNASLMLLDIEPFHPHHKTLKDIENAVKSGSKLTRQLLGYARKGKYNVRPINLNKIVEETSEAFGRTRKEIAIYPQLEKDLHSIEADQGQLEQVLLNLYVNAADAMSDGGDLVLETFNVNHTDMNGKLYNPKPGEYVKLTVRDTGIGIDKNTQERIFDPFFTTKEMGRGTGLGLASVYGIVKGHGGYIDVESKQAQGTTFSIFLPASGKAIQEKVESSNQFIQGSGTILIVDDEEMVLNTSAQMLKKLGYSVVEAASGRKAIEIYKENKDQVDLIILDMIMPEISGSEAYDKIKEIDPEVKVLLSSGYSIDGQASEILNRGCDGFIQKPFSFKNLSEKINEIVEI